MEAVADELSQQQIKSTLIPSWAIPNPPVIQQSSIFSILPSELILHIFSYLDVLTIFEFLDTCRYHRYLLLNMPEVWRRIRLIPLSEYTLLRQNNAAASPTTLSSAAAAAAATISNNDSAETTAAAAVIKPSLLLEHVENERDRERGGSRNLISEISAVLRRFWKENGLIDYVREIFVDSTYSPHFPSLLVRLIKFLSSVTTAANISNANSAETTAAAEVIKPSHRLKHAENERDRERGGSRSLMSEIYAVLRRFRKENGLIDHVREIFMDSTDSRHFPSPLVMLIKFPHLQVLSSRYRRAQTSLNTDTHTLKDMLRNGEVRPHSLELRRWDIFHPYMTVEDVVGFKTILDAISKVGQEPDSPGVVLDIKTCPGPIEGSAEAAAAVVAAGSQGNTNHHTAAMHWATPTQQTPISVTPPAIQATGSTSDSTLPQSPTSPKIPKCENVVWNLERCRICLSPQDRCYKCVKICYACKAVRAPPYINHQTQLERERTGRMGPTTASTAAGPATAGAFGRPLTPPGSISLSQLSNPGSAMPSAYLSLREASLANLTTTVATSSSVPPVAPLPVALPVPPEFSFFD
ncbi:hypothetical protein BGZ83_005721 [Gryganskiella cystojenkinii]|nr:hypothetical protein BGZ83_005721 [Gryganskiella cystojenkinii]